MIEKKTKEIITDWGLCFSIYPSIMDKLFVKINDIPPIDTERHAHWIEIKSNLFTCYCSNCGMSFCDIDEKCKIIVVIVVAKWMRLNNERYYKVLERYFNWENFNNKCDIFDWIVNI